MLSFLVAAPGCYCSHLPERFTFGADAAPDSAARDASGDAQQDACAPSSERCNGLDDDCDGAVDGPGASATCGSQPGAVSVACVSGACAVAECVEGNGDCNGLVDDGCEAPLAGLMHCGTCERTCAWLCEREACNDAERVSAGLEFACVLRSSGDVSCWGAGDHGQLGRGASGAGTMQPTARFVLRGASPLDGVREVSAGWRHACALTTSGMYTCWGDNMYGALGDGTMGSPSASPVALRGATLEYQQIDAGSLHTCAVRAGGRLRCWGRNLAGRLGDGTTTDRPLPTDVVGIATAQRVEAASAHSCALLLDRTVSCWGDNTVGQLGDGTLTSRPMPGLVAGIADARDLSSFAAHACVALGDGTVRCWGLNAGGQIGDGTTDNRSVPTLVVGITDAVAVGTANGHSCAVHGDGRVSCWGTPDPGDRHLVPFEVSGIDDAVDVVGGSDFTCALQARGGIQCWGQGTRGQLGDGASTTSPTPVDVVPPM